MGAGLGRSKNFTEEQAGQWTDDALGLESLDVPLPPQQEQQGSGATGTPGTPAAGQATSVEAAPTAPEQTPQTGTAPQEPSATQAQSPEGVPAPQGEAAPAEGSTEQQPGGEFIEFAGAKFRSLDEAATSYQNMRVMQQRTAEARNALQSEVDQYRQAMEALQPYLPAIEQMYRSGQLPVAQPQTPQATPLPEFDVSDPETWAKEVMRVTQENAIQAASQLVASQLAERDQLTATAASLSWTQEEYRVQAAQAVTEFRQRHPEAGPNSDTDRRMYEFVTGLHGLVGQQVIDPRDVDQLDLALEAMQNPVLAELLSVNPTWAGTPRGRQLLRANAGLGSQTPPSAPAGANGQGSTPPGAGTARIPPPAQVETGPSGAPTSGAPGERPPQDEFDAVLELSNKIRESGNIFGGVKN